MNLGIGTGAALFPEKEYIMEISFAVQLMEEKITKQHKLELLKTLPAASHSSLFNT
jgi:hypothetical protein